MTNIIISYNQIPYEVFKYFVFQFIQIPPNDFIKMRLINKDFYVFILQQLPKILSRDNKIRIHWKFAKVYPDFIPTRNVSYYDYTTNGYNTTIKAVCFQTKQATSEPTFRIREKQQLSSSIHKNSNQNILTKKQKQKVSNKFIEKHQKLQYINDNIFSHQTTCEDFIVKMMKMNDWSDGNMTISQFFEKYPN